MSTTTRPEDHRKPAIPAPHTEGKTIRWARLYDLGTTLLSFGQLAALHRRIVELAGVRPGERILDVGCGPGRLAVMAATAAGPAGEACGIDPAPEMVELARRKATQANVRARFEVGAIEALPCPNEHFDVVLSSLMLHHLPDALKRRDHGTLANLEKTTLGPGALAGLLDDVRGAVTPKAYDC